MALPVPIPNTVVKHGRSDDTRKGKVANRQMKAFLFLLTFSCFQCIIVKILWEAKTHELLGLSRYVVSDLYAHFSTSNLVFWDGDSIQHLDLAGMVVCPKVCSCLLCYILLLGNECHPMYASLACCIHCRWRRKRGSKKPLLIVWIVSFAARLLRKRAAFFLSFNLLS